MDHPPFPIGQRYLLLPLLCLLILLSGCASNPRPVSQLGRDAANSFEARYGGLFEDLDTQNYVQSVGIHLVHLASDLPSYHWQFRVLNSEEAGAYAVPGGRVYITHGLLTQLENESELAAILAHEIGHIATGQVWEQFRSSPAAQPSLAKASIPPPVETPLDRSTVDATATITQFSPAQEFSASAHAVRYLARAGYNPRALVWMIQKLQSRKNAQDFFQQHPLPPNRLTALEGLIAQRYPLLISTGDVGVDAFRAHVPSAGK